MIIMVHTSPKNVLCTRVIKGVDVEPFLISDRSQFDLKQMILE